MGWNDFSLPAVGERFDNEDGSSRQDEIRRCLPGDMVELVREPANQHDPMAVAIVSTRNVKMGYLGRDKARWIGSKINRGYDVRAVIDRVRGGFDDDDLVGLGLRINMEGEEPAPVRRAPCPTARRLMGEAAMAAG